MANLPADRHFAVGVRLADADARRSPTWQAGGWDSGTGRSRRGSRPGEPARPVAHVICICSSVIYKKQHHNSCRLVGVAFSPSKQKLIVRTDRSRRKFGNINDLCRLAPRNPYVKVPDSVRQSTRPRTSKYPAPYVKVPDSVRQSTRPRTSKYPAPYVKVPGPVRQSTRPLDRHRRCRRSPRIGSPRRHRLPASEPTTEPGVRPPGPGPVWWIRTVPPGRPGRQVRPAASARRIGAGPDGRALGIPGPSSGGSGVGSGRGGRGRRGPGRGRRPRGRWRRS